MSKGLLTEAYKRVAPHIHCTAILQSRLLNEKVGAAVFLKCENFQKMGAFKMRGAVHALLQLSEAEKQAGVITHSSGNFAQAISLAGAILGIPAHIVMPKNAPQVKKDAVLSYGGKIYESDNTATAREKRTAALVALHGYTFIHPSNDLQVIYGNATAAIELLEKQPDVDILLTPVGGGGLLAGTALAAHFFGSQVVTVGAEPKNVDDAYRSLQAGSIQYNHKNSTTIADGLRTYLGDINFPIIQQYVSEIIRVSENEIRDAMRFVWERMKIIIEPSSAVAIAALMQQHKKFRHKKIGIIISGGNVDLDNLPFNI